MTAAASLFPETSPFSLGGLPNEDELARICPQEFKKRNPWSDYASKVFYEGAIIDNWQWKSNDPAVQRRQKECFSGVLSGFMPHEKKEAVAGWMLSEMLTEVPVYIPRIRQTQAAQ